MENTQTVTVKLTNGETQTKTIQVPSPIPKSTVSPTQTPSQTHEKNQTTQTNSTKQKKTSTQTKQKPKRQSASEFIAVGLERIHTLIALKTQCDALRIDTVESFAVAEAIDNVLSQYEVEINPKTEAFLSLAATLFMIYAPKIKAYQEFKTK